MTKANNNQEHRYFIYLRKSTNDDEKQQRSIQDQLAEIRELVRKEGLEVVDTLAELQSAKYKGRPVFAEMLDRIEAGEADGIIAWHPDRLARNAVDGGRIIDMLDEGAIRDLRFCIHWFENTSQGKFMLMWSFGQSKYYVDMFSDGVKRAQKRMLAEGVWCWKAPVGYLNDPKTRRIVPHPVKAPLVQKMFELYATGEYAIAHIRGLMNKDGLHGDRRSELSLCGCQTILKNPFYYGVLVTGEDRHIASHEPLVSKELFDRCQAVMQKRTNHTRKPRLKVYVYRGFLRCAHCGCMVTMETQKGHNYLRCTKRVQKDCPQPYLREEVLTEQIGRGLTDLSLPDDWADWMVAKLRTEERENKATVATLANADQAAMRKLDERIDRLTSGYLEAGAFSVEEYKERKGELVAEKRVLIDNIKARTRTANLRFEPVIRFIHRSKQGKNVAARLDPTELRTELQYVGSNHRLDNRKLVFDPRGAWKTVAGQGVFAHIEKAAPVGAASPGGENHHRPLECPPKDSNLRPAD